MKLLKPILFSLFLLLLQFSVLSNTCQSEVQDAIIAIVNDEVITLKDLKDYMKTAFASMLSNGISKADINKRLAELESTGLNKLIEDRLILSEANKKGFKINEDAVDKKLDEIIGQYPSRQAFIKTLVDYGLTITDIRNKILDQLKIQSVLDSEVSSKIKIKPQEVTDFYKKNLAQFKKEEQADLDSIYIPFRDSNKKEAEEKIREALQLLKDGEDFTKVALKYSDTAPLGIIEKGQVLPSIEKTVFSLKEGEFSPIVEIESGFYIFKLKKLIPAQTAPLEDVKSSISKFLFQQKFNERLGEFLKKLKEKSYVEIKK